MDLRWKHIAIALAIFPVVAIVFAWIGFFNIGASSGHWKITEWALHTAMRAAVKTYAFLDVEPPADLPGENIAVAAGHFARGCAICHGAPGEQRPAWSDRALPPPPALGEKVGEWNDAELFWIVKHGVRFTGMPAWPTQARDDEVWAMVAFLRQLPVMSPQRYRLLSMGQAEQLTVAAPRQFEDTLAECARCHDANGARAGGLLPVIAGQSESYLLDALRAYAERRRASGMMAMPVAALDRGSLPELASHYAARQSGLRPVPADGDDGSAAARLVYRGDPARAIPACFGCHGALPNRNPAYPNIAGQSEAYLVNQLKLFRAATRGGGPNAHLMHKAAERLSDADIATLGQYLAQRPKSDATAGDGRR